MNKKKFKKLAQLEMIGLIVIVIIVITALLIYTVYKISSPQQNIQKRYMNKEVATNFLVSMINTNVEECHNLSLAQLIIDCAKTFPSISCQDYRGSCEVANKTILDILNRTLVNWSVSFNLSIERTPISFVNLGCDSRATEKEQGFEILPLNYVENIEIILDICAK